MSNIIDLNKHRERKEYNLCVARYQRAIEDVNFDAAIQLHIEVHERLKKMTGSVK